MPSTESPIATPRPWTWCANHRPTDTKGPHGFCPCDDREQRFRDMLAACADPLDRYPNVAALASAVLNAAGGHDAAGFCSVCGPAGHG